MFSIDKNTGDIVVHPQKNDHEDEEQWIPFHESESQHVPFPGIFTPSGIKSDLQPDIVQETEKENNILRSQVAYWKKMHQKAKERETALIEENKGLKAKIKKLLHMLFGRKSEKSKDNDPEKKETDNSGKKKNKRGQQPGSKGHGRRKHPNLPVREEDRDLNDDEKFCPCCNKPLSPFITTQDSDVIEIEVKAHIRRIRRKQYKPTCNCGHLPAIVTAPGHAKLIPKSYYGDSVWVEALIDKYLLFRPTNRFLEGLKLIGLDIPQGSLTGGMKYLTLFFQPVYDAIIEKNQSETHWHADETRWLVFAQLEGKSGNKWYMWVFKSKSTSVFILNPSRSAQTPKDHLGEIEVEIILSVDRYSAYKSFAIEMKQKGVTVRLAFCWAHVRRDFLDVYKGHAALESWVEDWLADIRKLYSLNNKRLEAPKPLDCEAQTELEKTVENMEQKCKKQLADKKIAPACEKVLTSLKNHWEGLTIFVDHPEVPLDNNPAELELRGTAVCRKNFYGSGAFWSGFLAAMMFTIFQTLKMFKINPKIWLAQYFRACAESKGKPDVTNFLPWNFKPPEEQNNSP